MKAMLVLVLILVAVVAWGGDWSNSKWSGKPKIMPNAVTFTGTTTMNGTNVLAGPTTLSGTNTLSGATTISGTAAFSSTVNMGGLTGGNSFTTTALLDTIVGTFGANPIVNVTLTSSGPADSSAIWVEYADADTIIFERYDAEISGQGYNYRVSQ